jgi:hypothetical protein
MPTFSSSIDDIILRPNILVSHEREARIPPFPNASPSLQCSAIFASASAVICESTRWISRPRNMNTNQDEALRFQAPPPSQPSVNQGNDRPADTIVAISQSHDRDVKAGIHRTRLRPASGKLDPTISRNNTGSPPQNAAGWGKCPKKGSARRMGKEERSVGSRDTRTSTGAWCCISWRHSKLQLSRHVIKPQHHLISVAWA